MTIVLTGQCSSTGTSLNSTNYTGSDCSGLNKATNRTLNVGGTPVVIIMEMDTLHPIIDYSVSGNVVTFLVPVYNQMNITVWC